MLARLLKTRSLMTTSSRHYRVLINKEETCFIVHHPEQEYEYKYTRPIPEESNHPESILKVDSKHMITQSPNLEQLQALTYTPATYWRQWPGREKRKKYREYFDDNVDRKGLTT